MKILKKIYSLLLIGCFLIVNLNSIVLAEDTDYIEKQIEKAEQIILEKYPDTNIYTVVQYNNTILEFGINEGYILFNLETLEIISDEKYDTVVALNNNEILAGIKSQNNKYDYHKIDINKNKNFIGTFYEIIDIDKDGYCYTRNLSKVNYKLYDQDDIYISEVYKYGILDKNFNTLFEPIWESPTGGFSGEFFKDNYCIVQRDGTLFEYVKGLGDIGNGKFGCISKDGKIIIEPIYDSLSYSGNNIFSGVKDNKSITINLNEDKNSDSSSIIDKSYDKWAEDSILKAIDNNIVPFMLQNNYKNAITRKEFCQIAVQLYMSMTNKNLDDIIKEKNIVLNNNIFSDTNDKNILIAYHLKIVNGVGNNKFLPDSKITRQEAAVMLNNLYTQLNLNYKIIEIEKYQDDNYIAQWAKESVYKMSGLKNENTKIAVFNGVGNNKFLPLGTYTKQESIATIIRIFELK